MVIDPVELARSLVPEIEARAADYDRRGSFPVQDVDALRNSGLLALMVPQRLGGLGASFTTYAAVARVLGRASGATALIFNMHASVTGALAAVPDDLARALGAGDAFFVGRDAVLRSAASGCLYQVAMSEPGAGARFSAMRSTYRSEQGGWRIRGRKTFCTGAGHADSYLVAARAEHDPSLVSQFVVPAGDGLKVEQTWDALGMRATASNDLILDVVVPDTALLGGVEGLAPLVASALPHWLVSSYAAVYVGVADAALHHAARDLSQRGLSSLPAVRARLGRADASTAAAWSATLDAGRLVDESPGSMEANRATYRAKLLAGDNAANVAASMIEACGASATRVGAALERIFRDARCGAVHPATSDVCADWLGAAALGLNPDADAAFPRW